MSDYSVQPGGSLKLKGGPSDSGIVKKKKKSSKAERDAKKAQERERIKALIKKEGKDQPHSGSSRNSPAPPGSSSDRKTDAEKRFEEVQRKRLADKVAKLANTTHKDRVNEFNSKLEALSEHHDIPKVGPG